MVATVLLVKDVRVRTFLIPDLVKVTVAVSTTGLFQAYKLRRGLGATFALE